MDNPKSDPTSLAHRLAQQLPESAQQASDLKRRAGALTCDWALVIGTVPFLMRHVDGTLLSSTQGPHLMRAWAFAISAPAEAWLAHWARVPAPGDHDIFALSKTGRLTIEGNLHPLMSRLQVFKDTLALPRTMPEMQP
ncbi:MAG: hypothetical protein AAFR04_04190 [Pseudomonadota bacterium]